MVKVGEFELGSKVVKVVIRLWLSESCGEKTGDGRIVSGKVGT